MAEKTKKILHTGVYSSPIGDISITEENGFIISVQLSKSDTENTPSHLTDLTFKEILEYLSGTRTYFTVPISPHGTDFQKKVWDSLCSIQYGNLKTYGEIAQEIGSPKGARAVGMAYNKNPIHIIIPCHRVIGKSGSLTGYAAGLNIKEKLILLEKKNGLK